MWRVITWQWYRDVQIFKLQINQLQFHLIFPSDIVRISIVAVCDVCTFTTLSYVLRSSFKLIRSSFKFIQFSFQDTSSSSSAFGVIDATNSRVWIKKKSCPLRTRIKVFKISLSGSFQNCKSIGIYLIWQSDSSLRCHLYKRYWYVIIYIYSERVRPR